MFITEYKSFSFPAKYNNLSKEDLFIKFANLNLFLWQSPILYNRKISQMLKKTISPNEPNNITWWKLWLKTVSIIAEAYDMPYLLYTVDKILENPTYYTDNELSEIILKFNDAIMLQKEFTIFVTIEQILSVYKNPQVNQGVLNLYKERDEIYNILNKYIPFEALNRNVLTTIKQNSNLEPSKIDYISMIREFLFRETIYDGNLKKKDFKNVINSFVNTKFSKNNPQVIDIMWDEISKILKNDDTPNKK